MGGCRAADAQLSAHRAGGAPSPSHPSGIVIELMFVSVTTLLDELRSVLDRLGSVDWRACDPEAVALAAVDLARGADRLEAISLLAIAEHDHRGGIARDGDASAGDWASRQTKTSKDTGRRTAARAKRIAKATKTAKAAAEGRLSTEQADKLASARTDDNAPSFDEHEDELIAKAEGSLEDAVKAAEDFRNSTGETPQDRADRLWKRRSAACWDDEDGMTQGRQSLAGDAAATFKAAFDAFVARQFTKDADDRRTNAQRRADASVEMARYALAGLRGEAPGPTDRAQVQILVRYEDLIDTNIADWAGELLGTGQPLAGHAIRRLCCDADIVRMVTKGESQIIDVGRRTRTVPVPTRKAVLARDGHRCTYPGCHSRDGLQVHHLRHWADLGATDLANIACLCWRHHHLVHEGGWKVELDHGSQRTIWTSPDGRRLIGQRRATAGASASAA